MKNGRQKIPSKKEAYDILVNERKVKTVKEIAKEWGVTYQLISYYCRKFGITERPYRVRGCGGYVNG